MMQLGVRLVADDAVHHVRAGFLQAGREPDVRRLVEARHQLDDDRDFLARCAPRPPVRRRPAIAARRGTASA